VSGPVNDTVGFDESKKSEGRTAMILKLTTVDQAEIWVNLSRILQMTVRSVDEGYPKTQIVMANGAAIYVSEAPDEIAAWTQLKRSAD
jgi:uncharacterized protein YlzI (FlbEa/FlbD family)